MTYSIYFDGRTIRVYLEEQYLTVVMLVKEKCPTAIVWVDDERAAA